MKNKSGKELHAIAKVILDIVIDNETNNSRNWIANAIDEIAEYLDAEFTDPLEGITQLENTVKGYEGYR